MIWVMNFKNEMRDIGGGGLVTRAGMGWSIVIRMRMKLCMASGTAICSSKYQWKYCQFSVECGSLVFYDLIRVNVSSSLAALWSLHE